MKKLAPFLIFILSIFISLHSCKKENVEDLVKVNNPIETPDSCGAENISFKDFVYPLIDQQCNGCHNANVQSGSINLEGYNNIKVQVDNGKLYGSINHETGFKAMPPTGVKLPECDIRKIKIWIDEGATNN